jgi:multiple sugar transport system permease protein
MFTVPIALRQYIDASSTSSLGPLFAMSALSLLPVLAFFLAFQRLLTQGIVSTGFK